MLKTFSWHFPVKIRFGIGIRREIAAAAKELGAKKVFVVTGKMGQPGYLSWPQAAKMRDQGMEIGSHTVHHYTLTEINLKEMERELRGSRLMLESNLSIPKAVFANPFGETAPAVVALLEKTGYQAACSSVVGLNRPGENLFMIRRMSVPRPKFGLWDFRLRLWWLNMLDRLEL